MKSLSKLITEMIWRVRLKITSEREVLITSLLGIAAWGVTIYLARFFLPMADGVTPTRFVLATLLIVAFLALAFWRKHSACKWLGIAVIITIFWLFFYSMIGTFLPEWLLTKDPWFEGSGPHEWILESAAKIYVLTIFAIAFFKMASKSFSLLGNFLLKVCFLRTIGGKKNE